MTPGARRRLWPRPRKRTDPRRWSRPRRFVDLTHSLGSDASVRRQARSTVVSHGRALFSSATVLAGVLLSACGSSAPAPVASVGPTGWAAYADPSMIDISLSDDGFQASDLSLRAEQQTMFMVFDAGSHPHRLQASLPMIAATVVDPATTAPPHSTAQVDLAVQPGEELDVTFTPTVAGTYALNIDGHPEAELVVLAAANVRT